MSEEVVSGSGMRSDVEERRFIVQVILFDKILYVGGFVEEAGAMCLPKLVPSIFGSVDVPGHKVKAIENLLTEMFGDVSVKYIGFIFKTSTVTRFYPCFAAPPRG
jgi:hypothetical protein